MIRLISIRFALLLFLAAVPMAYAAITLHAEASVSQIEASGVFEWRVSVSGGTKTPKVNLGSFQLVGGPSTSQQISFVNGAMSQSLELVYVLRAPANPGTYDLPVASLDAVSTPKQSMVVVAGGSATQTPPKSQQGRNALTPQQSQSRNGNNLAWIEVSTSPKEVYVGDRVRATYRIFFYQAQNLQITDLPQGGGFSLDNAKEIKQYKVERAERNGKPVNSAIVYDVWITPTRAGTIEVEPLEAQIDVIQQVQRKNNQFNLFNDPFSMFNDPMFNSTVVPLKVSSPKITISAKPLPGGKGGGEVWVGNISVTASIQPETIPVHQSATLILNIKGNSSIKSLNIPELKQVNGVEFYPPQSKIYGDGDNLRREIRYPLLPRAPGKYILEFQPISIFDPSSKQYHSLLKEELSLSAEGSASGAQPMVYVPQEPPTVAGEEQLPVPGIENSSNPLFFHKLTWLLSGSLLGLSLLAKSLLLLRSRGSVKERGALRNVRIRLTVAINNYGSSYETTSEDIEKILGNYLGLRYNHPNKYVAHPDQLESISESSAKTWMLLWQELRDLRYQPSQLVEQLRSAWKDKILQLLKEGES